MTGTMCLTFGDQGSALDPRRVKDPFETHFAFETRVSN